MKHGSLLRHSAVSRFRQALRSLDRLLYAAHVHHILIHKHATWPEGQTGTNRARYVIFNVPDTVSSQDLGLKHAAGCR